MRPETNEGMNETFNERYIYASKFWEGGGDLHIFYL